MTTKGIALALILGLTGCSSTYVGTFTVSRYTWEPLNSNLQATSGLCIKEASEPYVPNLYGGGWNIRKTLYKDCMEKNGYTKVGNEDSVTYPSVGWPTQRFTLDDQCRGNHTCIWQR